MASSIGVEFSKILTRKKYYVLLFLEIIIAAIIILFASANGFETLGFSFDLPTMPLIILNALMVFVLPLLIFMLCADLFTNEIETGMLKAVLLRPISRFAVFVSKFVSIALYILLHLMAICFVVLAIRLAIADSVEIFMTLAAYVIAIFPMMAFIALSIFISVIVGNSSLAMFVSLITYFVMQGISMFSVTVGAVFFTSHLNIYTMILSTPTHPALLNRVLLILSYIVLFSVAAFWLFDRKEL